MSDLFPAFKAKFGPGVRNREAGMIPADTDLEEKLSELVKLWKEEGLCRYGEGFLWRVNPADDADIIAEWITDKPVLVILRSAFGGLVYWDGEEGFYLDVLRNDSVYLCDSVTDILDWALCRDATLEKIMDRDVLVEALERLGPLEADECYGYLPPLPLGGDESVENLKKVGLQEHLALMRQCLE